MNAATSRPLLASQTPIEPATLRRIRATNLLSFGPEGIDLELSALNVLIGPNGSGKSNLLEVIRLLQAAPHDLADPVRTGGGVSDWIWRGQPQSSATVEVIIDNPHGTQPLRHVIAFRESGRRFTLDDERIENEHPYKKHSDSYFYYRLQGGRPALNINEAGRRDLQWGDVEPDRSILSQRKEPDQYPELAYLSAFYEGIRLYGSWEFGRSAGIRDAQRSDVRPSPLTENLSNLGMFLNRLAPYPAARARLKAHLTELYEGITDFELYFDPNSVQLLFTEGDYSIPASRLSDGSLRYLFLLAALLDPEPPRFLGIEEPELGLHPDLLPKLADLLVDASSRCQLLVTTHSDLLVDALSEHPESVVVCEKHDGRTSMRRLDRSDLARWLERYGLGQLWTKGKLGGVRW